MGSADLGKAFDRLAARKATDALERMRLPNQVLQPLRSAWKAQKRWLLAGAHGSRAHQPTCAPTGRPGLPTGTHGSPERITSPHPTPIPKQHTHLLHRRPRLGHLRGHRVRQHRQNMDDRGHDLGPHRKQLQARLRRLRRPQAPTSIGRHPVSYWHPRYHPDPPENPGHTHPAHTEARRRGPTRKGSYQASTAGRQMDPQPTTSSHGPPLFRKSYRHRKSSRGFLLKTPSTARAPTPPQGGLYRRQRQRSLPGTAPPRPYSGRLLPHRLHGMYPNPESSHGKPRDPSTMEPQTIPGPHRHMHPVAPAHRLDANILYDAL